MTAPFIICAIPRSRTAWLSHFLTYRDWFCHHEVALQMRTIDDVVKLFSTPRVGAAEPAAAYGWPILRQHFPEIKAVVIRRPVDEVVRSMLAVDVSEVGTYDPVALQRVMSRGARELDRVSATPGVLTVDFHDLHREDACAAIFEHCLPYKFDREWWEKFSKINIQVDVKSVLVYYHSHKAEIDGFKRACKTEMRRLAYEGLIGRSKGV